MTYFGHQRALRQYLRSMRQKFKKHEIKKIRKNVENLKKINAEEYNNTVAFFFLRK